MAKKSATEANQVEKTAPSYVKIRTAFKVSCPIVSLSTADPAQAVREIAKVLPDSPILEWDCVRGVVPAERQSTAAKKVASEILSATGGNLIDNGNLTDVLAESIKYVSGNNAGPKPVLPENTILIVHNAQRFIGDTPVVQAIWNCRDAFKQPRRLLVLLGTSFRMPVELQHDVIEIDEPLPNQTVLSEVIETVLTGADVEVERDSIEAAAAACQGLSAFAAEQLAALNLSRDGLSSTGVWRDKCAKINETPGLKVITHGSFANIAGVESAKKFVRGLLSGKDKPNCIVYIDEIEKSLGGASGDSSGVSQDQLGVLLQEMQDKRASGAIFYGVAGACKSALAKAAGSEAGIPTIQLDLGAMKGSLVGESETRIRDALKVIDAVSGGKTLWIATCNSLHALPPELRRRFRYGIWFFDLPTRRDREAIWSLYADKFGIDRDQISTDILSQEYSGAEIENCCEIAWRLNVTLTEATAYIVPIACSSADTINALRQSAANKFLDAAAGGVYKGRAEDTEPVAVGNASSRRIEL